MNIELLKVGSLVMVIGMGFVFFFIGVMIYSVEFTSKIIEFIGKYFPEKIEEDIYSKPKKTATNDDEIALAIACVYSQTH